MHKFEIKLPKSIIFIISILGIYSLGILIKLLFSIGKPSSFYLQLNGPISFQMNSIMIRLIIIFICLVLIMTLFAIFNKQVYKKQLLIAEIMQNIFNCILAIGYWYISHNHEITALVHNIAINQLSNLSAFWVWPIVLPITICTLTIFLLNELLQIRLKRNKLLNKSTNTINTIVKYLLMCSLSLVVFNSNLWIIYFIGIILALIKINQICKNKQLD